MKRPVVFKFIATNQHNSSNCQIYILLQTFTTNSANTANSTHSKSYEQAFGF